METLSVVGADKVELARLGNTYCPVCRLVFLLCCSSCFCFSFCFFCFSFPPFIPLAYGWTQWLSSTLIRTRWNTRRTGSLSSTRTTRRFILDHDLFSTLCSSEAAHKPSFPWLGAEGGWAWPRCCTQPEPGQGWKRFSTSLQHFLQGLVTITSTPGQPKTFQLVLTNNREQDLEEEKDPKKPTQIGLVVEQVKFWGNLSWRIKSHHPGWDPESRDDIRSARRIWSDWSWAQEDSSENWEEIQN